ncbi:cyclic lactone autoinducer peptide [Cohnella cholangitidis]|uniref:Cyclic lactone autoinducer peptide n=1 Tax=Cohnella cholangitidis TaxID=2598458 RepID=A0A7G5C1X7_9BACL|nr:cyclic lactone autoinducer peptide [Cohnella cholangitidis]QMV43211.1 cyclic lactone autoinducer peptide [Cohnella cholangitidis]
MKSKVARLLASGLGLVAVIFVTTACNGFIGHHPKAPAELLKK